MPATPFAVRVSGPMLMLLALLGLAGLAVLAARPVESAPAARTLRFDVAENSTRFVFAKDPVDAEGKPAYGNPFITQGYIYEYGTLTGGNGVLPDGSPEFPDRVIGEWTCRGWFVGNGMATRTGPIVITSQLYAFADGTITTDGYELVDLEKMIARAITGGTGAYTSAHGEANQMLLGMNAADGVNLRFELAVATR